MNYIRFLLGKITKEELQYRRIQRMTNRAWLREYNKNQGLK